MITKIFKFTESEFIQLKPYLKRIEIEPIIDAIKPKTHDKSPHATKRCLFYVGMTRAKKK